LRSDVSASTWAVAAVAAIVVGVGVSLAMQSRVGASSLVVSPEWAEVEWKFFWRGQEWSMAR